MNKGFLKKHGWWLLIILVAFFFRFWQIKHLPGGLFPDEAANGLDINLIFQGQLQPFFERSNGREALFFYFLAVVVGIFGRGPWQHHVVSAGFGLGTVILTYFLAKRMFGKRVALLASFLMAVSSFAVTMTRTAFRANLVPFFATLAVLFLVKLLESPDARKRLTAAIGLGISFALGFYTYGAFRMMVPLLFGFAVLYLFGKRNELKALWFNYKKPLAAFVISFLITIAPIAYYFGTHPGSFNGRTAQVSVFSPDLNKGDLKGTIITVTKKTVLGFFTQGDENWRHNVAGYPFLPPLVSPFFALGIIILLWNLLKFLKQVWTKQISNETFYKAFIVVWFGFMLVPELITAEGIPHGLRLTGVISTVFIIAAFGINWIWERLEKYLRIRSIRLGIITVFIATIFVYNFNLYFGIAANSPEYYYAFRSDLTEVSNYLNQRNDKKTTYLSLDDFSVQTVEYLTTPTNQPYILVDPAHSFEVNLRRGDVIVFTQSTLFDSKRFLETHPDARLIKQQKNQFDQIIMQVYQQP